jgi:uncharacterized protein (TIGR03545 family)
MIILMLLVAALAMSADPLAQQFTVGSLEKATGAKVDIGQLKVSLGKQKVYIKEIGIADPKNPMTNLVQADMAYLNLDRGPLARRQFVVNHGQASNVVFGAPRTEDGSISETPLLAAAQTKWSPKQFAAPGDRAQDWVDSLSFVDSSDPANLDLELVSLAQQSTALWKSELTQINSEVQELDRRTRVVKEIQKDDLNNPLRREKVLSEGDLDAINLKSKALASRLIELQTKAIEVRQALKVAHQSDISKINAASGAPAFNSDTVSDLLLGDMNEEFIGEILGWFHWFKNAIPEPATNQSLRGVNLPLYGVEQKPSFLIKTIDLEGQGWIANRHISFAGTAYDLTHQPRLHDQPASFDLRAQGNEHVLISCVLDRRTDKTIDTLGILCPDLELPSRMLGEENSMLVTMGAGSKIQADVKIQLIDDQVQGKIVFRHSNVSLHVDEVHPMAGGKDVALQMNRGLGELKQFESEILLSGTISDYHYRATSDFGPQFANSVNRLLVDKEELVSKRRISELDQILDIQLQNIDQQVFPMIESLSQSLDKYNFEMASIRNLISPPLGSATKLR